MLFSIQLDFKEGIYIDQVDANDFISASKRWAKNIDSDIIYGLTKKKKEKFILLLESKENYPIPIDGRINVWVIHLHIGRDVLDAHLYAMSEEY